MFRRRRREEAPWPIRLEATTVRGDHLVLRALTVDDRQEYQALRRTNLLWLSPWDATSPDPHAPGRTFEDLVEGFDAEARAGRMLPFVIELNGRLVGQLSVANIVLGSFRSCSVGYWVARAVAGRGIMPTALARVGDHLLGPMGLHRIEVNIRPENDASLAVVRKLQLRDEGLRRRMLHIDGDWRDHRSFAVTVEDLAGQSLTDRLTQSSHQSLWRHTEEAPPPGA